MNHSYNITRSSNTVELSAAWDSASWKNIPLMKIDNFRQESSEHRPVVEAKLQHDSRKLYILFKVQDRYVRAVQTEYQSSVCTDSTVEAFIRPTEGKGYFNFEVNCGGTMLLYYITDHTRAPGGFKDFQKVKKEDLDGLEVFHTMPQVVEPEIQTPAEWRLGLAIPFSFFEKYTGVKAVPEGTWKANFYKCADHTSHPHWASWAPVPQLNFHLPDSFAELKFQ